MDDQPNRFPGQDGSQSLLTTAAADDTIQANDAAIAGGDSQITSSDDSDLHVTRGHDPGMALDSHQANATASPTSGNAAGNEKDLTPEFVFGKWAVYACAVGNFGLSLSLPIALSSMFLDWQEAFDESRAHTVSVHSTAMGILFGGAIIPGYMVNRLGARFTVLVGSFLASVGFFVSYFATSINFLIATTGVLGGLGFCFINLPAFPAVTMAFQPKYRSLAVSICTCGAALLNMAFPFLYRFISHHYTWRGAFIFISGLCLQTVWMGLIMTSYVKRPYKKNLSVGVDKATDTQSHLLSEENLSITKESGADEGSEKLDSGEEQCDPHDETRQSEVMKLTVDNHKEKDQSRVAEKHFSPQDIFQRVKTSKWGFLLDYMYILVILNICTSLATMLSFVLITMDFAQTKGFPDESTGVFFLLIIFITSLFGRLLTGPLNMIPHLHSIIIQGIFGMVSGFSLIVLGSATGYATIVTFLVIQGLGLGAAVAIYAKSILDIDTVSMDIYPLALGVAGTLEGIFDFCIPILIGYSVDVTGSYFTILHVLGGISFATSLTLVVVKTALTCRDFRATKSDTKNIS